LWALDGVAGGIQPWWHYVNAYHEDRRLYQTPVAMGQWLAEHEEFLIRRRPIATVGILYSQRNNDFFGRDDAELQVNLPQRGFTQALTRARVPFLFVHADDIPRDPAGLRVLILPNLGTLSDAQIDGVRGFVNRGGSVVATGVTSLFDHWGEMRADFGLAEVLGVSLPPTHPWRDPASRRQRALENTQTYLRLSPELRAKTFGPHAPDEPAVLGTRHPALNGFDDTDILPFGGSLTPITVDSTARVLMTFVPPRPAFPPEAVWLREARTDVPALVVRERIGNGRVAYLAADLDRRYARDNIGDIGTLLVNLVRWAARDDVPLSVDGPGLLDCHLYQQPGRVILHVVNLTNEGTWRGPIDELIPVGPLRVRVRLPDDVRGRTLRLLAAAGAGGAARGRPLRVTDGWAEFTLASVTDHEVAVLE
jgi:hypothetical protein